MKKLFFIINFLLSVFYSFAQREYWGMTVSGGKDYDSLGGAGAGVIFKTNKYGKHYEVAYNFDSATGIEPWGSLIKATNGKMYGLSCALSSTMFTTLFEFDPMTRQYRVLLKADTLRGGRSYRFGSPFQASNGKLYSLASNTLIETDLNTGINTVITDGLNPASGENHFMQASNGKVYFVTINTNGLVGQRGGIFELDLLSKKVVLRYQFLDQTGSSSYGVPVEWTPGVLYGTFNGGTGNDSTIDGGGIFKYNLNTGIYEVKKTFFNIGIKSRFIAKGGLIRFGNKLYGATKYGGVADKGFIYSYDPATNDLDTLTNFANTYWHPQPPFDTLRGIDYYVANGWSTELLASNDNKLYGLTYNAMFSYNPADSQFQALNYLGPGFTNYSGKLGIYTNYAHLLEACTPPYYLSTIPDTIHVFQNQPFSFTISTPNTDTFRWVKDATSVLPLQKDSTLKFDTTRLADQGWYTCTLKNECGDSTTKRFYLKVDIVTPLPLAFSGTVKGSSALLQWTDPAPKDVDAYTLQRSADGRSFTTIHTTKAMPYQQGYNYTDESFETFAIANNGKAFYRLLQKNKDGKEALSNVVVLHTSANSPITISPNPASDLVVISFPKTIKKGELSIVDSKGAIVWQQAANRRNIAISTTAWANGTYTINLTNETGKLDTRQLVIQHP